MKNILRKIIFVAFLVQYISLQLYAQKDTTELEIGSKKLLIIDKKTQQENAIYNLEKGKETFEREIANAEKEIVKQNKIIEDLQVKQNQLLSKIEKDKELKVSGENGKTRKAEDDIQLEKDKIEIEKCKIEIEKHNQIISANQKKQKAFKSGIVEIEKGISEIEDGLKTIDEELSVLEGNSNDTIVAKKHKKRFNAHWAGFEFGLLNFVNKNQSFVNDQEASFMKIIPEKTFTYGLNIFELNIPFTKYSLGIATGAGLRWNSLNLEKNVDLVVNENNELTGEPIDINIEELRKNKLNIAYVKVPLLIEYQTPIKNRKLYFSAGLFGEIRAWSKQKQIYIVDGVKHKGKKVDDFQLSPFRYGVSARAGYGDIGVFVEYALIPLFKDDNAPEMYPIMIGVRLVDF